MYSGALEGTRKEKIEKLRQIPKLQVTYIVFGED